MRLAPLSENKNRQTSFTTLHRRKGCFDGVVHPKRSILLKPNPFQKKTKRITLFQNVFKNIFSQLRTLLRKKEKSLDGILLHKKRKFSLKKAKHLFKETIRWYTRQNTLAKVSAFLILAILSGTYLFPFASQGATYSFNQTSWAGGVTGNTATHPGNQSNWNQYSAQSGLTVGADVTLPSNNLSIVDNGDAADTWDLMTASTENGYDGASLVHPGSGDYIYGWRGGGGNPFYRYSISGNNWSTMAVAPGAVGAGGALVYPGSGDYIYGWRGISSTDFYRYSISGNSWTTMTATPGIIGLGASLVYPGSGDFIYGYQGSTTAFYRYSISGNTWTSMAVTPGSTGYGASLVYPGSGNYIYGYQGSTTAFYRYSISGNSWTSMAVTPGAIANGGALVYSGSGDYIYGYRGGGTDFYRYSITGNNWTNMAATPYTISYGGSLVSSGDFIYGFRGQDGNSFLRYRVTSTAIHFQSGTHSGTLVTNQNPRITKLNGDLWTIVGNGPSGGTTWGASLVYPGSGDFIYGTVGMGVTAFYRYSISGNSWTTMTAIPAALNQEGSSLVSPGGDYIYLTRGDSTDFYRYSISGNSWTTMTATPGVISSGGDLVYPGSG